MSGDFIKTNFLCQYKVWEEAYVYVPTDSKYEDVKKILSPLCRNLDRFEMVAANEATLKM
jgi:hypothetical protein